MKACEKLGKDPRDCLVLEDSESGILAAYRADIPVICIPDMKAPSDEILEKTVTALKTLDEVIAYLEEKNAKIK